MEKNRVFLDIVIFIAAALIVIQVAPRFNGFFAGIVTGVTLLRIVDFLGNRRRQKQVG